MKKIIAGIIGFSGLLLLMGAVGSDCDGKCMENALPIGEVVLYSLIGLGMIVIGLILGDAFNEEQKF